MAARYHFVQAEVFTARPFGGNQLAVFTDARGLTTEEMQTLAREMNYSESAFVLPLEIPGAVKRVRIFTPGREMPMAGHPTVGATYVLASRGELEARSSLSEKGRFSGNEGISSVQGRSGFPGDLCDLGLDLSGDPFRY